MVNCLEALWCGINLSTQNLNRCEQSMTNPRVKIYSTGRCPICDKTKTLLNKWGIAYLEVRVDSDRAGLIEMSRITDGARSVPQITIDGRWIGSFMDLTELHMEGELDGLMQNE